MVRVLVIEDNPVNMKLAALLLRKAGHAVQCAADAEAGLILARADPPDLILMDIQLPGMDGLAATALLKQDPATVDIPVIALTAMTMNADHEKSQAAGCAAYVTKPLRYQELYAAIDDVLGVKTLRFPLKAGLSDGASIQQAQGEATSRTDTVDAVDVRVLEGLIGNDPAAIREFQNSFRISAAGIALELKAACSARQPDQAGRQAHKLRSSAHIVGALALSKLCAEMEAAGRAGNTETLIELLPLFERELDAVNAFVDTFQLAGADTGREKGQKP